jgi:chloramphenicol-sensitive protein RarD
MTPLVNVLLGSIILRERLSVWQIASILLASIAVSILAFGYGQFPWIAVGLCSSFGLYGLLRKQSGTAAIPGLFLETTFLLPVAIFYLVFLASRGALTFGPSHLSLSAILTTTGIVTAVPLVWFGYAARHLRLVTVGFLQYLSPSISFLLGLFVYHETFTRQHFITFLLIWMALAIVSAEAVLQWRASKRIAADAITETPLIEPGI